jgi:hypothetical protein
MIARGIGLLTQALASAPDALIQAWRNADRRARRVFFVGSPARHMARTGQHRRPRAGSIPGGLRRRLAKGAGA